jgi:hypothetical protein
MWAIGLGGYGLGKKARNAGSVNADYKVHDENAQLSVIRKQKAGDSLKS